MSDLPPLPQTASSDGREIWDWAGKLSESVHRTARIIEIKRDLRRIGTTCSDCYHWMKSSSCPREHNVNGRWFGPDMNAPICEKFVLNSRAEQRREDLTAKLQTEGVSP